MNQQENDEGYDCNSAPTAEERTEDMNPSWITETGVREHKKKNLRLLHVS